MWRMDPQIYWEIRNSFIGACHTICFILYLFLNFSETHKFFAFGMEKLSILCWAIDKLENQGPSSNNATSTRKEIPEKNWKKKSYHHEKCDLQGQGGEFLQLSSYYTVFYIVARPQPDR